MKIVDLLLRLAPPIILLGLSIVFTRRRLNREFPLFFAYLFYVPVATILRMAVMHQPQPYFWLYWSTEAGYGIFALLVLREVFHRLFATAYENYRWFAFLLPFLVLSIFGLSLWETLYHPLGHGYLSEGTHAIYWFDLGVHLVEGTILLLLVLLAAAFPIAWRQHEFGILAGFGLNASLTMTVYLLRFELGSGYEGLFHYGPPLAYLCATLIWWHVFWRPPRAAHQPQINIAEWQEVLRRSKELLERVKKALGWQQTAAVPPV